MLVQREPSNQFCFHDAVPTQPIMQERTFNFLFNKRGQTELKQSLVEMQPNVDLTNCHGSVPVSNFREVSEKGWFFNLPLLQSSLFSERGYSNENERSS